MRMPVRQRSALGLPGLVGHRPGRPPHPAACCPGCRPGDIAVLDHLDLDRATAQALVDADVAAVVNAAPMISGRFPNLGPQVLADAGVLVVDGIGHAGLAAVGDGRTVRLHDGRRVRRRTSRSRSGRELDAETVARRAGPGPLRPGHPARDVHPQQHRVPAPRAGPAAARPRRAAAGDPGRGPPGRGRRPRPRPRAPSSPQIRPFLREQHPVLIGVGARRRRAPRGRLQARRRRAGRARRRAPRCRRRRRCAPPATSWSGSTAAPHRSTVDQLERLGVRPLRFESAATPEDAGADRSPTPRDAAVIVGVGMHATLDDFLDRQRAGLASTYLTRLKVGPRLVDAAAVPYLYSGRVRPWHLLLVMLAGLVALAAAVAVTPVGQEWADRRCHRHSTLARTLLVISYRHHIVSLVAVFLALAVGIALGGGPLSDLGRDDRPAAAATHDKRPTAPVCGVRRRVRDRERRGRCTPNGLSDRTVSVVTLPGADADAISALGAQVEAAGGTVAGTYDVQPALTDAAEKSLVDTLGSQLADQLGSGRGERGRPDVRPDRPAPRPRRRRGRPARARTRPRSGRAWPAPSCSTSPDDAVPRAGGAGRARRPDRPGDPLRRRERAWPPRRPASWSRATPPHGRRRPRAPRGARCGDGRPRSTASTRRSAR